MRPLALGRKNWIHIGSPEAGPRVAAILSLVETCRRLAVPVRQYPADVLPGLADISIHNVTHPRGLGRAPKQVTSGCQPVDALTLTPSQSVLASLALPQAHAGGVNAAHLRDLGRGLVRLDGFSGDFGLSG